VRVIDFCLFIVLRSLKFLLWPFLETVSIIVITIIDQSKIQATCCPVPVSLVEKSLKRSSLV
jgi:hypothetical protein